jgi:hypothetical protein
MASKATYNYQDIERYLQRQMSSSEMHAFEKAMMSDPFLADALEGFQASDPALANQHLTEINQQIKPKKDKAKVVGFNGTAKWLRIAALIIVIIGAAIITYKVFDKPTDTTQIAATKQQPPLPVDSVSTSEEAVTEQALPGKAVIGNTNTSPVIREDIATQQSVAAAPPPAIESSSNEAAGLALVDTSAQSKSLEARNVTATTTAPAELKEVVVQGRSVASAPKDMNESLLKKRSAAPARDGWVRFQAYIDKEVTLAKQKNSALNAMQVELEFSVDNNGNIADIKVISASNTEVAKVAVDIFKKSPPWLPLANNPKAKIVVNF